MNRLLKKKVGQIDIIYDGLEWDVYSDTTRRIRLGGQWLETEKPAVVSALVSHQFGHFIFEEMGYGEKDAGKETFELIVRGLNGREQMLIPEGQYLYHDSETVGMGVLIGWISNEPSEVFANIFSIAIQLDGESNNIAAFAKNISLYIKTAWTAGYVINYTDRMLDALAEKEKSR